MDGDLRAGAMAVIWTREDIEALMPIEEPPLDSAEPVAATEFVRIVAVARILMPASYVRDPSAVRI